MMIYRNRAIYALDVAFLEQNFAGFRTKHLHFVLFNDLASLQLFDLTVEIAVFTHSDVLECSKCGEMKSDKSGFAFSCFLCPKGTKADVLQFSMMVEVFKMTFKLEDADLEVDCCENRGIIFFSFRLVLSTLLSTKFWSRLSFFPTD